MKFTDQIKNFTEKTEALIADKEKEVEDNAKNNLHITLGDDVSLIESGTLDIQTGKFYDIVAPDSILVKLRSANLLQE